MRLKRIGIQIFILLLALAYVPVYADEDNYQIVDNHSDLKESFDSYSDAYKYYSKNVDSYDNLLLYEGDKLIKMEYGVVCFDADNDYVNYYSTLRRQDDTIAPGYGCDGAYLYTYDDDVYFKMAGDIGYTSIDNVTLIAYEDLINPSSYYCDDTYLYHNIKNQFANNYYATSLKIDFIPEFLDSNTKYYSYDGHYFYDDFTLMIDDYNNGTYENAVNSEPYYNYYQYLSYRSLSSYSYLELEDYFYNTLGMDGSLINYFDYNGDEAADQINRSQFYGVIDDFFTSQNVYGANALMLISSAINESSYGRSYASFYNNSLYNEYGFDSSDETNNNRYNSISNSIYAYAKYYVSNRYGNHLRDDYCGEFAGDKYSGFTSTYKLDQYYGEKLAATYFDIDNQLGLKDYKKYSLAIINDGVSFYNDASLNDYNYSVSNNQLCLVILQEEEDSYLVQLEDSFDEDYIYDFEENVAYISKQDVAYVINNNSDFDYDYVTITYDFAGGSFNNKDSISIKTLVGSVPALIEPVYEGYEFVGYDSEIGVASEDITYTANYKKISNISIGHLFENQSELYPVIDLNDAYINVKYEDGTSSKLAITTDMLSYIDINSHDEQTVVVTYCGVSDSKNITIKENESSENVNNAVERNNVEYVKNNIDDLYIPLSMSLIRDFDTFLIEKDNRNYVIKDNVNNNNNFSISGLDLSLKDQSSLSFFKDTYYVEVDSISNSSKDKIESVAKGYGFDSVLGLDISFKFNFQKVSLNGPVVCQIKIDDKQDNTIYSVYHLDSNGDVIKCKTTYSDNYVQFIASESGEYLVLSKKGFNNISIEDHIENLSYENMGYDNHRFNLNVLWIMVLLIICFMGVIVYYIIRNKNQLLWKDYKKLLLRVDTAQEEKRKI